MSTFCQNSLKKLLNDYLLVATCCVSTLLFSGQVCVIASLLGCCGILESIMEKPSLFWGHIVHPWIAAITSFQT